MNVEIRQAVLADAETVAPLFDAYRQFYQQSADMSLALAFIRERLARQDSVILLAEDSLKVAVGFLQMYPSFSSVSARRIWIMNDLYVSHSARGQGVAHALMQAAKAHAAATGAKRIVLSTGHDNPAQKLYESLGYQRDTYFFHYSLPLD